MIIVHFSEYASGGVATYLKDLITAQTQRKNVDKIYLFLSKYNSDSDLINLKGEKVIVIPYQYQRSVSGIVKLLRLSKAIKKIKPDVIHVHSSFAGLIRLNFIFSPLKKRVVYCSHGWSFNQEISEWKKIIYRFVEWFLSFGCSKIINISKSERKSADFIKSDKLVTIYNSIPLSQNRQVNFRSPSNHLNVVFIGRLDRQKGVDILLKAFNKVNANGFFHLSIVGDAVIDPVVKNKNEKYIHFLGWKNRNEIQRILEKSDLLIVPSRWEGFGLVSLEAMSAGKMVVASDAGALPEIVEDGKTGLIFKSDSIDSLCRTLNRLKRMSFTNIMDYGLAGRERYVNKFNYSYMVNRVMALYESNIK